MAKALGVRAPRLSVPKSLALTGVVALELASRLTGRNPPLTRTGVDFFGHDRQYPWEKARRELGYQPQYDVPDGMAQTVAWYRQQSWL